MEATVALTAGHVIEFWASGPGSLRIFAGDQLLWQVPAFAPYPDFYRYRHGEVGTVTLSWDAPEAILWAYGYDPATVAETGITVYDFSAEGLLQRQGADIDAWLASDPRRPRLHFSPIQQWMNDPNGLCRVGDTWHMFYQFHPAGTDWGPMHWGHATSKDLFAWTHLPVLLHPEQNLWRLGATGGAFSGNAFTDLNGETVFFYTERLPAYDLFSGYREVQKLARLDSDMLGVVGVQTVLDALPHGVAHDFRDPKVWWDAASGAYRMVLGSALEGDPAVLLFGSPNLTSWTYLGPLYRAPAHYREHGARAVECPDFFPLGERWVMVMSFVGYTEPATGRHNLLYARVGRFENDRFIADREELQLLDFGTDYYAMQSFAAGERQLAFAWLFNWEDRKPAGSLYSGEMSLPRELRINSAGHLTMLPAAELDRAWPTDKLAQQKGGYALAGDAPVEVFLSGLLDDTLVVASENGTTCFEIAVTNGLLSIRLPQDDGSIRYETQFRGATDLKLVHDRGIIEVFGDGGTVCGTRRNYAGIAPNRLVVSTGAEVTVSERRKCTR